MNLLKAASTISLLTLASRVTGLVRDQLIAATFGATAATDAFNVAFRIPNLLRRLFGEGAFSQAFVPILAATRAREGDEATHGLIDAVATVLVWALVATCVVGIVAAPAIVWLMASGLDHFEQAVRVLEDYAFESRMGSTLIVREPFGVCGFITPWNWPLNQIASKLAPALAAGCTVVVKPSEVAPLSAIIFAEVLHDADVPKGVFNLVNGDGPAVGQAIAAHPEIDLCITHLRNVWASHLDSERRALADHAYANDPPGYVFQTALVRRRVFGRIGTLNEKLRRAEDIEWFGRARDAGLKLEILPEVLVRRHLHGRNTSDSGEATASERYQQLLDVVAARLKQRAPGEFLTSPPSTKEKKRDRQGAANHST